MKQTISEYFEEKIKEKAKTFVEESLRDIKDYVAKDEYEEILTDLMNIYIAGANSAKEVLTEITMLRKKGKI